MRPQSFDNHLKDEPRVGTPIRRSLVSGIQNPLYSNDRSVWVLNAQFSRHDQKSGQSPEFGCSNVPNLDVEALNWSNFSMGSNIRTRSLCKCSVFQ